MKMRDFSGIRDNLRPVWAGRNKTDGRGDDCEQLIKPV
jgi:hypothetical protein